MNKKFELINLEDLTLDQRREVFYGIVELMQNKPVPRHKELRALVETYHHRGVTDFYGMPAPEKMLLAASYIRSMDEPDRWDIVSDIRDFDIPDELSDVMAHVSAQLMFSGNEGTERAMKFMDELIEKVIAYVAEGVQDEFDIVDSHTVVEHEDNR